MPQFQMLTVDGMSDADILAAVRSGSHALVPIGDGAVVGQISLDDYEAVEGEPVLLMPLTREQCKFVAPQVIR